MCAPHRYFIFHYSRSVFLHMGLYSQLEACSMCSYSTRQVQSGYYVLPFSLHCKVYSFCTGVNDCRRCKEVKILEQNIITSLALSCLPSEYLLMYVEITKDIQKSMKEEEKLKLKQQKTAKCKSVPCSTMCIAWKFSLCDHVCAQFDLFKFLHPLGCIHSLQNNSYYDR